MTPLKQHIPFVADGPYPARPGNFVRPLIDGEPAFRRICEAVEAAQHNVYVTVAFIHDDFLMPGGHGSFFDVLDRAVGRGLDVRVLFWRSSLDINIDHNTCFRGTVEHKDMLRGRGSTFGIRWDRAGEAVCHHQKSWIVDAGHPTETAFVGGINLNPRYVATPGHKDRADGTHDAYVEVAGPSATDVHHNFAQRWNNASERDAPDGIWGNSGSTDLELPIRVSTRRGTSPVQIQRTMMALHEHTIFAQYRQAIECAQRTIYIENQAFESPEVVDLLDAALRRGVKVIALVPADAQPAVRARRQDPDSQALFRSLAALGEHKDFTMVGIASMQPDGSRNNVYIHAKLMLVDDAFATIGSCNNRPQSFVRNTEINASFYDPDVVRALRVKLFAEHLEVETSAMDDAAAMRLYADTADSNADRPDDWQGNVFSFAPSRFAT